MSPNTGQIFEFPEGASIPEGWANVTPGTCVKVEFPGAKPLVMRITEVSHTHHTVKLRAATPDEARLYDVNRRLEDALKP